MRLHLRVLLDLRSSPTVLSVSLLIAQSKPGRAHQKYTIPARALRGFFHLGQLCTSGGPGRNRTAVLNTFHSTSYNNFILRPCRCYQHKSKTDTSQQTVQQTCHQQLTNLIAYKSFYTIYLANSHNVSKSLTAYCIHLLPVESPSGPKETPIVLPAKC